MQYQQGTIGCELALKLPREAWILVYSFRGEMCSQNLLKFQDDWSDILLMKYLNLNLHE